MTQQGLKLTFDWLDIGPFLAIIKITNKQPTDTRNLAQRETGEGQNFRTSFKQVAGSSWVGYTHNSLKHSYLGAVQNL